MRWPRAAALVLVCQLAFGCAGTAASDGGRIPAQARIPAREATTGEPGDEALTSAVIESASRTPETAPDPASQPHQDHPADDPNAEDPTADGATDPGPDPGPALRPGWLGTRVLALATDGYGVRQPTPPELVDRRLPPVAIATPRPAAPPADGTFRGTLGPVPAAVVSRSTWHEGCPVGLADLRYLTVTFVGFDGADHTGELIVHADVAAAILEVFAALHAARFPLEEVRVIAAAELTAPPTGDGNVSSAFVCRPAVGTNRWSDHAFGRAIDVNPFHNPYVRGDLVLPELASAYADRTHVRPGMVMAGDVVTAAFGGVGWSWGGAWTGAAVDPMHFSRSGR
jgi:hypothetical protein